MAPDPRDPRVTVTLNLSAAAFADVYDLCPLDVGDRFREHVRQLPGVHPCSVSITLTVPQPEPSH